MMKNLDNWPTHTHIGRLSNFIKNLPDDPIFIKTYLPIVQKEYSSELCFLSVITRTQGKRPQELFEALLSLTEQTYKNFEVIVVCHNIDTASLESVQKILSDTRLSSLSSRIICVDGGTRATPLNHGFAHARGEYIACLDDDDTVLNNWVSSFHEAATAQPGTMLHTQIIVQKWDRDKDGAFSYGEDSRIYCKPYNEILQFADNCCPLHSIAFPGYIFRQCGVIFDEKLSTIEDWDMILRVQGLAGVTEIPYPTGIYKFWKRSENSYSSHSHEEWLNNKKRVNIKLSKSLYILSNNGIGEIISLIEKQKNINKGSDISDNDVYYRIIKSLHFLIIIFTYINYSIYTLLSIISSGKSKHNFLSQKEIWKQHRKVLRHM